MPDENRNVAYAIVFGNYSPSEVHSLWCTREQAEAEIRNLGDGVLEIEEMEVRGVRAPDPAVLRELEKVEKSLRAAVENNPYDDDLELYSACLRGADAIARVRRKLGGDA